MMYEFVKMGCPTWRENCPHGEKAATACELRPDGRRRSTVVACVDASEVEFSNTAEAPAQCRYCTGLVRWDEITRRFEHVGRSPGHCSTPVPVPRSAPVVEPDKLEAS